MIRRVLLLICAVLALSGMAQAGGRSSCRAELADVFTVRCTLEQTVVAVGNFEMAAGFDWRPLQRLEPTPYTALLWLDSSWWAALEVGNRWGAAWFVSVAFGLRW